jgi:hypothetical protein
MNKLGIDVGGVIIDRKRNDSSDTSLFGPNYLQAHAVPGAFQTIQKLHEIFGDQVYIVSKCGQNIERKTREWMEANRFHDETGVPKEQLRFCRSRADKAPICEELEITHFIDDKLEVLSYLDTVPNKFLFDPSLNEIATWKQHLPKVQIVESWAEVLALLAPDSKKVGDTLLSWVKLKYSEEAILGDFLAGDGVRFSLEHYPTCYRRGQWKLLIEVNESSAPHKWGCFDEQDQPVRFYHSEERARQEAEAIAKVLQQDRKERG